MFKFETGICHPAPHKTFTTLAEVWSFVKSLDDAKTLVDVICCTETGDIVSPPYSNEDTPALIEERVDGSTEPRRWMLQK